jgi:hypothetical protein
VYDFIDFRCIRVTKIEPRDNALNMRMILKMNTVTIHHLSDFHTRNVYFALVCGTIIVSSILSVNLFA